MRTISTGLLCVALGTVLILAPGDATALGHRAPPVPMQNVVLEVSHPKTCCKIDVPVCIPCCCQGPPCVRFEHTILGHGKTVFTWTCGYQVTVRYTHGGGIRVVQRD
jgi:hypothetical protein